MFKAAWKSLLGRKLRLLMSTFAIVLGVAFVAGTLIFSDTLNRQLHGAVRVDRRRRRRAPHGRRVGGRHALDSHRPCRAGRGAGVRGGRGTSGRQRDRSRRVRHRPGQQGGRRQRAAGDRRQLVRCAGGPRPRGSVDRGRQAAAGAGRGGVLRRDCRGLRLHDRRPGAAGHGHGSGPAGSGAGRHRRLRGGRHPQRRHPGHVRHAHRPGAVPGRGGRVHRPLGDG